MKRARQLADKSKILKKSKNFLNKILTFIKSSIIYFIISSLINKYYNKLSKKLSHIIHNKKLKKIKNKRPIFKDSAKINYINVHRSYFNFIEIITRYQNQAAFLIKTLIPYNLLNQAEEKYAKTEYLKNTDHKLVDEYKEKNNLKNKNFAAIDKKILEEISDIMLNENKELLSFIDKKSIKTNIKHINK